MCREAAFRNSFSSASIGRRVDARLALAALRAAIANRQPPKDCIHHSDRGSQYAAEGFLDVNYWLHELKTWALSISLDDTDSANLPYRNVGIPFERAYCETPDGILIIDTSNPNEPKVRRLEIGENTNNLAIVPTPISDALDLTAHGVTANV